MAELVNETWFIAVMAVVGAVVLILIIVIILLCFIWIKQRKQNEENRHHTSMNNNVQGKHHPPSNDLSNSQNWVLVYPSDKVSAPASNDTTARVIRGNDPAVAGSSLIHMDREIRSSIHTQPNIPTAHEKTRYNDAFDLDGDLGYGSEISSPPRISRKEGNKEFRAKKPQISNVSVISSKKNESHTVYRTSSESALGNNSTVGSPKVMNLSYQIPQVDYDDAPSFVMYGSEEYITWQGINANDHAHSTKVKGIANAFEHPKETSPMSSPTRAAVENELKELAQTTPMKKRLSQRNPAGNPKPDQKRISNPLEGIPDESEEWKRRTGKSTIQSRLKRFKKAGAMSVFPD